MRRGLGSQAAVSAAGPAGRLLERLEGSFRGRVRRVDVILTAIVLYGAEGLLAVAAVAGLRERTVVRRTLEANPGCRIESCAQGYVTSSSTTGSRWLLAACLALLALAAVLTTVLVATMRRSLGAGPSPHRGAAPLPDDPVGLPGEEDAGGVGAVAHPVGGQHDVGR